MFPCLVFVPGDPYARLMGAAGGHSHSLGVGAGLRLHRPGRKIKWWGACLGRDKAPSPSGPLLRAGISHSLEFIT